MPSVTEAVSLVRQEKKGVAHRMERELPQQDTIFPQQVPPSAPVGGEKQIEAKQDHEREYHREYNRRPERIAYKQQWYQQKKAERAADPEARDQFKEAHRESKKRWRAKKKQEIAPRAISKSESIA